MAQTATNTFYNREQEREDKAQERDQRKVTRLARVLATLQGSPMANPKCLVLDLEALGSQGQNAAQLMAFVASHFRRLATV